MNIDRQRISAVTVLEDLGYTFSEGRWQAPALFRRPYGRSPLFGLLADQAGELMGCVEGSAEDAQLHRIRGVPRSLPSRSGGRVEGRRPRTVRRPSS